MSALATALAALADAGLRPVTLEVSEEAAHRIGTPLNVTIGGGEAKSGRYADWARARESLVHAIRDLLPDELVTVEGCRYAYEWDRGPGAACTCNYGPLLLLPRLAEPRDAFERADFAERLLGALAGTGLAVKAPRLLPWATSPIEQAGGAVRGLGYTYAWGPRPPRNATLPDPGEIERRIGARRAIRAPLVHPVLAAAAGTIEDPTTFGTVETELGPWEWLLAHAFVRNHRIEILRAEPIGAALASAIPELVERRLAKPDGAPKSAADPIPLMRGAALRLNASRADLHIA